MKTKVSGCCGTCVCASILMTTNSLDYPDEVSGLKLIADYAIQANWVTENENATVNSSTFIGISFILVKYMLK